MPRSTSSECWPSQGAARRIAVRSPVGLDRQAQRLHGTDLRVFDIDHHLARLDVRIVQGLLVAVHRPARDLGRIHASRPNGPWSACPARFRFRCSSSSTLASRRASDAKPRVCHPLGLFADHRAEIPPELLAAGPDRHVAVLGAVGLVRAPSGDGGCRSPPEFRREPKKAPNSQMLQASPASSSEVSRYWPLPWRSRPM